jgi:hypothetical protein
MVRTSLRDALRMTPAFLRTESRSKNDSGLRVFDHQVSFTAARGYDAATQDFRDDAGRIGGAVDAMIGLLIGRQTLRMKRAKAALVSEQRPAGHGHAARQQNFDGRVEPDNRNIGSAEKFGSASLRVGAAAKSQDGGFFQLQNTAESRAQLVCFDLPKSGLAEAFEDFGNAEARGGFDAIVEVDESPGELPGE